MSTEIIVIVVVVAALIGVAIVNSKKHKRRSPGTVVSPAPAPAPAPAPVPEPEPEPEPEPPAVLLDRHGNAPGDVGYDPRVDRSADQFSPPHPVGSHYGEGTFDPDKMWFGPDGVHNP